MKFEDFDSKSVALKSRSVLGVRSLLHRFGELDRSDNGKDSEVEQRKLE